MFCKPMTQRALSTTSFIALASIASATTFTVDDSGGFDFTDIQSAVNAAADGDSIMIRPGTYTDFTIEDKALNVFAQPDTGQVNIVGTVFVANLSKFKRVVLSGINATGRAVWPLSEQALVMNVNVGAVRFQGCTIKGGAGARHPSKIECEWNFDPYGAGGLAVDLFYCTDLAFTGCTIVGGAGLGDGSCGWAAGGQGGDAVEARSSQVALYDCAVTGGRGGNAVSTGGDGGVAFREPTGGFFASGSTFTGGAGGDTSDPNSDAGAGGAGVFVGTNGNAHLLGNTLTGGAAGHAFAQSPEPPGAALSGTGFVEQLTGTRRKFTSQRIAAPGSIINVSILGQSGDQVFLPWSSGSAWRYLSINKGTWLIPLPARRMTQPIGVIPASGTLTTKIQLPPLPPGLDAALTAMQCLVIDTSGNAILGSPMHILRK